MRYKTYSYFINTAISLLLLFCIGFPAQAQQVQQRHQASAAEREQKKKKKEKEAVPDTIPFYNGTYIGVDVYGVGGKLLGSDIMSSEVGVKVNLKNKFIPTFEFGMGAADTWSETGVHYKSKAAPFFRIGVDYNTMAKKKEKNSFLYVGLRYGFTSFKYSVYNKPVDDPIWGDEIGSASIKDDVWKETLPFNHPGMKCNMQWFELVLGVNVKIYKSFYMGWAIRMKYKTSASIDEYANPWYIPGYGKFKSNNMGMTYSLIYKLP